MHNNYFNPSITTSTATPSDKNNELNIVFFKSEKDNTPNTKSFTWQEMCNRFGKHEERENKQGCPAWSPVNYKLGTTRGNHNVESIYLAVLDIDNGTPVEIIKEKLKGYAALIHTSFSHTAELPKYRIIVPLAKPVPAAEWPQTWTRINAYLGNVNDPATKDAARIYFIPAKPAASAGHFVAVMEGAWLDVDLLPELPAVVAAKDEHRSVGIASYTHCHIEGIEEPLPDLSPGKGLDEVLARCEFMKWASAEVTQPDVSEPDWMAMMTNACRFESRENWIHEASWHHPSYNKNDTDKRITRYQNNGGPVTCGRIKDLGYAGCPEGGCQLPSGNNTKAPAGLWVWLLE